MIGALLFVVFILCLVYLLIKKCFGEILDDRVMVKALDGRMYKVRNTPHKQETANALARLNTKLLTFTERLAMECPPHFKPVVFRMKRRFRPEAVSEGSVDKRYTSYTINKGEKMVLCMRTRDQRDELYDDNLLFYVALHELAHIASITENHSEEFHANFRFLLRKAQEWDMFKRVQKPFNYCGLHVNGM